MVMMVMDRYHNFTKVMYNHHHLHLHHPSPLDAGVALNRSYSLCGSPICGVFLPGWSKWELRLRVLEAELG